MSDFQIIKENFLKYANQISFPETGLDQDGRITTKDVGIVMSRWGENFVFFEESDSQGRENEVNQVGVKVRISRSYTSPVRVDYEVESTEANGVNEGTGQDYSLESGTSTFLPGETQKIIYLNIIDDNINEIDEKLKITLKNPSAEVELANSTYIYTIQDNGSG